MIKKEIQEKLKTDFTYWYHNIDLGDGVVTPGLGYFPMWDNTKKVMDRVDYNGKRVLDIAAYDGMFTFEAEKRGAQEVVATDCLYRSFKNFLFCKEVLESNAIPYYNVSPYNIFDRLDVYFEENYDNEKPYERLFDIVQHYGLLYHLRDPLLSLSQARSCLKDGGTLVLETNMAVGEKESKLIFNGIPSTHRISENVSVWFVPTLPFLKEALRSTFFELDLDSVSSVKVEASLQTQRNIKLPPGERIYDIQRTAMTAKAIPIDDSPFARELKRTYRNPGLDRW